MWSPRNESTSKQLWQRLLAIFEHFLKDASNRDSLREGAQNPETHFIVDGVLDQGANHMIAVFSDKRMPMVELLERPFLLLIREMIVPLEFRDARDPLPAKGQEGQQAKRSHDLGSHPSERWQAADSGSNGVDAGRWNQSQFAQFGPRRWGHDSRQISGIGKKQKYFLDRLRNPVLELSMKAHFSHWNCTSQTPPHWTNRLGSR